MSIRDLQKVYAKTSMPMVGATDVSVASVLRLAAWGVVVAVVLQLAFYFVFRVVGYGFFEHSLDSVGDSCSFASGWFESSEESRNMITCLLGLDFELIKHN